VSSVVVYGVLLMIYDDECYYYYYYFINCYGIIMLYSVFKEEHYFLYIHI
jgi:hypothetical protein